MKALEIQETFGLDQLRFVERPTPTPEPGHVRVRVRAVSLNFRDLLMVRGLYNPRQPLPLIPCSDGVGLIDAVGEGVTAFTVGDRVIGCFAQDWEDGPLTTSAQSSTLGGPRDGMLCEYRCLPQHGVAKVPPHLSDAQAASLPCAALTAWSALVTHGKLEAGQTVVVLGTGGVSLFALQFAKSLGATVVVTSSSDAKLERVRDLGADHTVNYARTPDWHKAIRPLIGGADHVVEVGGAGTFDRSTRCLRPGGQLHLIGVLSGTNPPVNLTRVLMNQLRVQGVFVGHHNSLKTMLKHIEAKALQPVVDRVHPFEESVAAFHDFAAASHIGKTCIAVSS